MSPESPSILADQEAGPQRVPGFTVALPQFEGPFDLLLSLIARRRLDVTELALAEVTDEFLDYMRADWNLASASEFLVVAATLLALKAHRLLPHDPEEDDGEDIELLEARDLLFARLLQYRAYKQAAAAIAHQAATAFTRPGPPGVQTVHLHERVPVTEQLGLLAQRVREAGTLTFTELTADADRTAMVVARFLALLILHRQGSVDLEQDEAMSEITVSWCGGQADPEGMMTSDVDEEFS